MNIKLAREDEAFRGELSEWLENELSGDFREVRGRGGPGDEHAMLDERRAWEKRLGAAGWTCVGWPSEYGGRGLPLSQQMIYHEEYARAGGPGRLGHIGEGLLGPTLIAFGDEARHEILREVDPVRARALAGIAEFLDRVAPAGARP